MTIELCKCVYCGADTGIDANVEVCLSCETQITKTEHEARAKAEREYKEHQALYDSEDGREWRRLNPGK